MKTLGLCAQKGGAGKTTIAIHMAVIAEALGISVAIVDTDPQRSALKWWQRRSTHYPLLAEAAPDELPLIQETARKEGLELLIVDTAPAHGPDVAAIARASDFVLVPTRPSILDLDAIGSTVDILVATEARGAIVLNACPAPHLDAETDAQVGESPTTQEARAALSDSPINLTPIALSQRAAFSHALNDGRAVTEFEPDGKAAYEITALWNWVRGEVRA